MTKKALEHPALGSEITSDGKIRTSWLVSLCRTKANQVMMMKRRGYEIEDSEMDWLQASVDDVKLAEMVNMMRKHISNKSTQVSFAERFNKTYKITHQSLSKQFTGEVYPYIKDEADEIPQEIGQFRFENNSMVFVKGQDELIVSEVRTTEVSYGNIQKLLGTEHAPFHQIPTAILIDTGDENMFKSDHIGIYRMKFNIEIFHVQHLVYDVFQHWLVPTQRVLGDVEKLLLLCPYYITSSKEARQNCLFLESQLPTISMEDAAVRRLGAVPGNIIYWENESYLTTLDNMESGYMLVTGIVGDTSKIISGPEMEAEVDDLIDEMEDEDEESDDDEPNEAFEEEF
jgi:DNA-directed RNA polymerase subunit H (RpoH/RPB5)